MTQKWEYKFFTDNLGYSKNRVVTNFTNASLNDLGNEGWELVSVVPQCNDIQTPGYTDLFLWIFKRPIEK